MISVVTGLRYNAQGELVGVYTKDMYTPEEVDTMINKNVREKVDELALRIKRIENRL